MAGRSTPQIERSSTEMIERARHFAETTLDEDPAGADLDHLPEKHFDEMAALGLYGIDVPGRFGGTEVNVAARREITEILAGACPATWFVWTQHVGTASRVEAATGSAARALLPKMATGEVRMATAYSDLRHERPSLKATRVAGGVRFDGRASFVTGWGYTTHVVIGGLTNDNEALFAVADMTASPQFAPRMMRDMDVMSTTGTAVVQLDGLVIPDEMILGAEPWREFQLADNRRTANASPATFGVARAILSGWGELVSHEDSGFRRMTRLIDDCRDDAYFYADTWQAQFGLEHRRELRARSVIATKRAAEHYYTEVGARATSRRDPANRFQRVASFLTHQARTPEMKQVFQREEQRVASFVDSPMSEQDLGPLVDRDRRDTSRGETERALPTPSIRFDLGTPGNPPTGPEF